MGKREKKRVRITVVEADKSKNGKEHRKGLKTKIEKTQEKGGSGKTFKETLMQSQMNEMDYFMKTSIVDVERCDPRCRVGNITEGVSESKMSEKWLEEGDQVGWEDKDEGGILEENFKRLAIWEKADVRSQSRLGKNEKKRAMRRLVSKNRPDMLFIQETKLKEESRDIYERLWGKDKICGKSALAEVDWIRKRSVGGVILKIDFEKVYDNVCWEFMELIMRKMGFMEKWIEWVRECSITARVSVLVNGSPTGQFGMEKGLRQGCPLFPFLFNIVVEAMSRMIKKAEILRLCKGVEIGNNGFIISHLQYADDTIFFCDPNLENLRELRRMLRCFQVEKTRNDPSDLMPNTSVNRKVSTLWKRIISPFSPSNKYFLQVQSNFSFITGNGENLRFWQDDWLEGVTLAISFPRLFALAENTYGKVAKFGNWVDGFWEWKVETKIQLFDLEIDQPAQLQGMLQEQQVSKDFKDELIWKREPSGKYTYKSFCKYALSSMEIMEGIWKSVWAKLAPLRVEVFVWQMFLDIYRQPPIQSLHGKSMLGRKQIKWEMPKPSQMKFNMDGAARGSSGPIGIGGILKYSNGVVKVTFSKPIRLADANLVEILAVREAFVIFSTSRWKNDYSLCIESDSSNAVKWTKQPDTAPWKMRKWLIQMERMKEELNGWTIRHIMRETNERVDNLAKQGVQLQSDIIQIF
ncbi:Uncharacterized protein TCM_022286 [Theobroma cacao]|uniref:RNase H type-1 domain-containing protein n=1 Tax=Theobroma cacao TaxID=3641 RepID=A0A061F0B4_THECC|nr:Uncharacterized protein TCM_022286 [Theobroma cacao]